MGIRVCEKSGWRIGYDVTATVVSAVLFVGCLTMKYELLKKTSIPNPPLSAVAVSIKQFPVESRASIIDPHAAVSGPGRTFNPTESRLAEISRPSRLEDLSGAIVRELRNERIRTLLTLDQIKALDNTRLVTNPFTLVAEADPQCMLEVSGRVLISSHKTRDLFSPNTDAITITVSVKDLKTGRVSEKTPIRTLIAVPFDSKELEDAMAVAVVTVMTKKTIF
jgi:hypothetical protein